MASLADDFKKEKDLGAAFAAEPDAEVEAAGAEPGSPLARALASQPGDIVTVTDPAEGELGRFTREGQRVMSPEEVRGNLAANEGVASQQALRSFLAGGGPFLDELAGVKAVGERGLDSLRKALGGNLEARNPLDVYRSARDAERRESQQAQEALPALSFGGQVAATLPAGVAGGGLGLGGRLLSQAGANAAVAGGMGLGESGLDATQGQSPELALQALENMATGGALGAAGELGASALGAGSRYLGTKASAAMDALRAQLQRQADKAVNSARGSLGGVIAGQNNIADTLRDVLSRPQFFSAETVDAANRAVMSPEGQALMNRSVAGNIEKLGDALSREAPAREAFAEAIAAAKPEVIAETAALRADPLAVLKDVGGKAGASLGQRAALGAAGAGLGFLMGDTAGAGIGAGMGYMAPGALQFMRNTVRNPANRAAVFGVGESALQGLSQVPRAASVVENAALRSEEPNRVGYESIISRWLQPGAPQELVQQAQGQADANARRNLVESTNGVAPQE